MLPPTMVITERMRFSSSVSAAQSNRGQAPRGRRACPPRSCPAGPPRARTSRCRAVYSLSTSCRVICWPGVDQHTARVDAGRGVVHVDPRIHRRDLHAVGAHAGVDAVVHDHPERRARCGVGVPARYLPAGERQAAADRLPAVDPFRGDERHVRDHPSLVARSGYSRVDRLEARLRSRLLEVVCAPSECTSARHPAAATRFAASRNAAGPVPPGDELADAAGAHHVVAEERERVLQALARARGAGVGVHVQEVDPQPRRQPALARAPTRNGRCIVKLSSCAAPSAGVLVAWNAPWSRCVVTPRLSRVFHRVERAAPSRLGC